MNLPYSKAALPRRWVTVGLGAGRCRPFTLPKREQVPAHQGGCAAAFASAPRS